MWGYRCRCGERQYWGALPPAPCHGCPACGTTPAMLPATPAAPAPHDWQTQQVRTDHGDQPLTYCRYCGLSRREFERQART